MKKTYRILGISLCAALILPLAACGGRDPNPVASVQYGDNTKSCSALEFEISAAQDEMRRLIGQKSGKTNTNVALGVAGAFFIVPWFFMDFKGAETQEYEAYRQRSLRLSSLAIDRNCGLEYQEFPTIKELRESSQS